MRGCRLYASHDISSEELARDRVHVETDIDFISESELFLLLSEAGFEKPFAVLPDLFVRRLGGRETRLSAEPMAAASARQSRMSIALGDRAEMRTELARLPSKNRKGLQKEPGSCSP